MLFRVKLGSDDVIATSNLRLSEISSTGDGENDEGNELCCVSANKFVEKKLLTFLRPKIVFELKLL